MKALLRQEAIRDLQAEAATDQSLHRTLSALNLTTLGVGANSRLATQSAGASPG